jgi:hypothetical protein
MSRQAGEGAPEYHFNGTQYVVMDTPPASNTQPLYRCRDDFGTHFQSNAFNCEGLGARLAESLLGYVYVDDPKNGAERIRRCIGVAGAPIVSMLESDVDATCTKDQWIVQSISVGYAFPRGFRGSAGKGRRTERGRNWRVRAIIEGIDAPPILVRLPDRRRGRCRDLRWTPRSATLHDPLGSNERVADHFGSPRRTRSFE